MRSLVRRGATKMVYQVAGDRLEIEFLDYVAVFGMRFANQLPGKGVALCNSTTAALRLLADADLPCHFVERLSDRSILVRPGFRSPGGYLDKSTPAALPWEAVTRYHVAGSLLARLNHGVNFPEVGSPTRGAPLLRPIFELGRRNAVDGRYLPKLRGGLSRRRSCAKVLENLSFAADAVLRPRLESLGLLHIDGKKEFAFDVTGNLMIVDACFTVEEDRIWRITANGALIDLSLDPARDYYRRMLGLTGAGLDAINLTSVEMPDPLASALLSAYVELGEAMLSLR